MSDLRKYKVKTSDLTKKCTGLKFQTTADIEPLREIVGQERAADALALGLDIESKGYNIYLSGYLGTGKTSLAIKMVQTKAEQKPVPSDWCYVYNFMKPDSPRILKFTAGQGKEFQQVITLSINRAVADITKAFESEEFVAKKNDLVNGLVEETNNRYVQLEEEMRKLGYSLSKGPNGISCVPMKDGEILTQDDYAGMDEAQRSQLVHENRIMQDKLNQALQQYKEMERSTNIEVNNLEKETARKVAARYFTGLFDKYRTCEKVVAYLEEMEADLLANTEILTEPEESSVSGVFKTRNKKSFLRRYQVNLLVDNSGLKHAPVVIEPNPTYAKLFGQIEYEGEFGVLATDFSKIKAGAVHRANGGYLILHMYDVAKNFYIWDTLKRVLKEETIAVESLGKNLGWSNAETMEPEAMPVNFKVILIGAPIYYYLLYQRDEEFEKLFKIKADFDIEMERTPKHINDCARFVASVCAREQLRPFEREAVARVIDYSSRMADNKTKLTTRFSELEQIICEADCWARHDNAEIVTAEHVHRALVEKTRRAGLIEEKIQQSIDRQDLIINVEGERIGELNGLAVYALGDINFGKPVRITAKTFMGEKGLVNIEREIRMSGSIHSKGVLTLNGYMGAQYAQDKPMGLSASLTFEQSYQGIEGDSASSAELYALLSSLAEVPVNQGIAVTGSVNQNGEIQPVGGVNEKIEGFFKVCRHRGLTGRQGVIIPRQNISGLMLDEEIVTAVRQHRFTIWAVDHIDQGLEILTGTPAGVRDERGKFSPDSVHYLVDKKLRAWNELRREPGVTARHVSGGIRRKRGRL